MLAKSLLQSIRGKLFDLGVCFRLDASARACKVIEANCDCIRFSLEPWHTKNPAFVQLTNLAS